MRKILLFTLCSLLVILLNNCENNIAESDDFIECLQKEKVLDSIISDSIIYIVWDYSAKNQILNKYKYPSNGSKEIYFVSMSQVFMNEIREYIGITEISYTKKHKYKIRFTYIKDGPDKYILRKYYLTGFCNDFNLRQLN